MPHRRKPEKGSFGTRFDDLVSQFPVGEEAPPAKGPAQRPREFQEKVDIHSALFERAWKLDGER